MWWIPCVAVLAGLVPGAKGRGRAADTASVPNARDLAKAGKLLYAVLDTDLGTLTVELDPRAAPQSVEAFVGAAAASNHGVYDGLIFHRTIPGFLIQSGDPKGTGVGPPAFTVPDETQLPEQKALHFTLGSVGLAKGPGGSGSQFFILVGDAPWLDGLCVRIGQVITGLDVANRIAAAPRGPLDRPLAPVVLKHVRILDRPPG